MTLANRLTLARLGLTVFFMLCLFARQLIFSYLALGLFILASATDWLDGHIARTRNQVTNFGKLMDPIADKILVLSAFVAFVELGLIPAWMVVVILARELLVTGVRLLASSQGIVLAATDAGKHKLVSQLGAIYTILIAMIWRHTALQMGRWQASWDAPLAATLSAVMLIAVALSLVSGCAFLWRHRALLMADS